MESYFSKIPLDLLTLIVSSLTIDRIDDLCLITDKCDPAFWDTLYRIKFNKRPPENSRKWFGDRIKEYRYYLITKETNPAIYQMADSGMINELQNILNDHPVLSLNALYGVLMGATKGGHRNIVDLIVKSHASNYNDLIYKYPFNMAAARGNKYLMDLFQSLTKINISDEDRLSIAIFSAQSGDLEMIKQSLGNIGTLSPKDLQMIFPGVIDSGNEESFDWFINNFSDDINKLSNTQFADLLIHPAYYGNMRVFNKMLDVFRRTLAPEEYASIMESAISGGQEEIIRKLLFLGAGKSERSYAKWMITAAQYNKRDIFEWMVYLGKDKIKREDYQIAFDKTSDQDIRHIIRTYFLKK